MITDQQKTIIRHLWERAQIPGNRLETFYQDHFYSTEGRFGYPACVHLLNSKNEVIDSWVFRYSSNPSICADTVEAIDAYLVTLDAEVSGTNASNRPLEADENARAMPPSYPSSQATLETLGGDSE